MILSIIVAMGEDRAIGKDNQLLWRLSDDLRRFKALTTGHTILMGRRTYESLPNGALPNRRNIVISRTLSSLPGAEVYASIEEALSEVEQDEEVFVIGGGAIYGATLPRVDRIYLTCVRASFPGADTFFPALDMEQWVEQEVQEYPADERNEYATRFSLLVRKRGQC